MLFVSEYASQKVQALMQEANVTKENFFVRVSVVGGGCSGLSYKITTIYFNKSIKTDFFLPKDFYVTQLETSQNTYSMYFDCRTTI